MRRSLHARSATAIGLAIQADKEAGYVLSEKFTRYFGVWREADSGNRITFDPLFPKGTPLPGPDESRTKFGGAIIRSTTSGIFVIWSAAI